MTGDGLGEHFFLPGDTVYRPEELAGEQDSSRSVYCYLPCVVGRYAASKVFNAFSV